MSRHLLAPARAGLLALVAAALAGCLSGAGGPAGRPHAGASPAPVATPAPAPAGAPRSATVIALDMSGSMAQNDPDDIRCAAARTYVGLSRAGDLIGLIGFGGAGAASWTGGRLVDVGGGRDELEADVGTHCGAAAPGGETPTYGALDQARQELAAVAGGGPRSVVLLTDGVPTEGATPTGALEQRIESQLVPAFHQNGWHVDTIALGTDAIDFGFLQRIASETGGTYYDGSRGQRATALNLLPAFVDVLQHEDGRSPGAPAREQSGGSLTFTVPPLASHLDVVVVCRTACTAQLHSPRGADVSPVQPVSAADGRPSVGAVFSVDQPSTVRSGTGGLVPWSVTVQGGGAAAVSSLVDLSLGIELAPGPSPHVLGGPITIAASVVEADGAPHADPTLILSGSADPGAGGQAIPFELEPTGGNAYQGTFTVPATARPGDYDVVVRAALTSDAEPLATASRYVGVGLVPAPTVDGGVVTATRWPGPLAALYSLPLVDRLAGLALAGVPAMPAATVTGTLAGPDGGAFMEPATVSARVADRPGGPAGAGAVAAQARGGRFGLTFPAPAAGTYALVVGAEGPDSLGQSVPRATSVRVALRPASVPQVARAVAVTALLALLLLLLLAYARFCLLRPPYGEWRVGDDADAIPLSHRRSVAEAFLSRNRIKSRDPEGLEFRFGYRSGITVRPWHAAGAEWRLVTGEELPRGFAAEDRLLHAATAYSITGDEQWTWRQWLAAVPVALGLPVRMPRLHDDAYGAGGDHASYIY